MKTVIFDLDGTLADIAHRLHHIKNGNRDWDSFFNECIYDKPKEPIVELLRMCHDLGREIIICSGRSDRVKQETLDWLAEHGIPFHKIYMRPEGSRIKDEDLKYSWLENGLLGDKKDILFVVEDRTRMVDMWRANGLTCLQVDRWEE